MYLCAEIPRLSQIYIYLGDCIVETNICKMQTVFCLNGQSKY